MPTVNIKTDYGATGDGQLATAILTTNGVGNKTVTSTTSLWLVGDVGKKISIAGCDTVSGSNPLGAFLTTIASFISGTQIVLLDSPIVTLSSVSTLVEWGTDDNLAFTAFHTANVGVSNVVLNMPAGRYCFARLGIGNGFCFGIPSLQIVGSGTVWLSDMLGVGNGYFMGGSLTAQRDDNTHDARLATAISGTSSLTLLNASEASRFSVNTWALLTGFDLQGFGFPTNPLYREWVFIIAISGTTITLNASISNTYKSTWPVYFAGNASAADQGGPATLYALDQNWNCVHEYVGIRFQSIPTLFNSNGRSITFTNCVANAFGPNISQTKDFIATIDMSTAAQWEVDKLNTTVLLQNSTIRSLLSFSASADLLTAQNVTMTVGLNGTPKAFVAENSTFADAVFGPTAYGPATSVDCDTCVFNDFTNFGGVGETDIFGAGAYSYNSGVFVRVKSAGSGGPPQWAAPGYPTLYGSRYISEGLFTVLDIIEDGTSIYILTNLTGAFPSPVAPATTFTFLTHPAPSLLFQNCSGADAALAWSNAPSARPIYSYWGLTYTGNIGATKPVLNIFGTIVSAKFTVNSAYAAGAFNLDGPFVIEKPNNTQRTWTPSIDLTKVGIRTITRNGVTGSTGSDSGLALPGTGDIWLVPGQIVPKMAGITGSGSITLELITEQGVIPPPPPPPPPPIPDMQPPSGYPNLNPITTTTLRHRNFLVSSGYPHAKGTLVSPYGHRPNQRLGSTFRSGSPIAHRIGSGTKLPPRRK